MNPISNLVNYITGRHAVLRLPEVERSLLQRLHRRFADALTRRDHDSLRQLLASDVELREGQALRSGRTDVLVALDAHTREAELSVDNAEVSLHGDTAVVEALWHHDCPERGHFTLLRSCVFARQRGYWQLVSLRDLPTGRMAQPVT